MNFKTLNKLNHVQVNIDGINKRNSHFESVFIITQGEKYHNIFQDDLLPSISIFTQEIKEIKEILNNKRIIKCHFCNDNLKPKTFEYIIPKTGSIDKVECYSKLMDELNELSEYFKRCLFRYSIWYELDDISKVNEIENYLNSKINSKFVIYLGSGLEHIN